MPYNTIESLKTKYESLLSILQNDIPKLLDHSNVPNYFAHLLPINAPVEPTSTNPEFLQILLISFYSDKINYLKLILSLTLMALFKDTNLYSPLTHRAIRDLISNL